MPQPSLSSEPKFKQSSSWLDTLLLYAAVVAAFIAMYTPQAVLPVIARDLSASPSAVSLTVSLLIFGIAGASLVTGPLSDRVGRKPMLVGCTLLLSVPSLLCAFAPNLGVLLVWRFLQGCLVPGITAVTVTYLTEEFERGRSSALIGGYIGATVFGGLVSRVLSGFVTDLFGWRWMFVLSAGVALLVGLLLLRLQPSTHFHAAPKFTQAFKGLLSHLSNRPILGGLGVGFCLFFAFIAIFTYLPFYVEAPPFNFSPSATGLIYLVYAAGLLSSPLSGLLTQRLSRRLVMALGMLVALAANFATLVPNTPFLVAALLILCFGNFATQSTATSFVATQADHDRGGANSLYLFTYYIGGSLGAFLPGLLLPSFGWAGVLALTCTMLVLGITTALLFCRE